MNLKSIFGYFSRRARKFFIDFQNSLPVKRYDERDLLRALTVAKIHDKTFSEYKNKFCGRDVVILATGPSLNDYKPLEGVVNIGVNKSFLYDKVTLDFLFMQDWGVKAYIDKLDDEKYSNVVKFFGTAPEAYFDCKTRKIKDCIIPESVALKFGARRYFQYSTFSMSSLKFSKDIDCNYLECGGSVALAAVQFALFTNPRKIYLVGCDCTNGYFYEKPEKLKKNRIYAESWAKLKEFAEIYYPDTRIISVNPRGLRGLFEDFDQ